MAFARPVTVAAICLAGAWVSAGAQSSQRAPSLNTDSAEIAFASNRDGNWEIYVTDAAGRSQTRLTRRDVQDRFPLWSPDGAQIAFGSQVGNSWELWVMDADGSRERRLHAPIIPKSARGWSRDGKQIAFTGVADNNVDVYVVDVEIRPGEAADVVSWRGPRPVLVA